MRGSRSCVEHLEGRRLLSGTVQTVFEDGLLRIIGDDASNTVYVQRDYDNPDPSALEVTGRDGTLINGVFQRGGFHFSGVRDIEVRLHDGDDEIHLVGLRLKGGVSIDGGAADDAAYIRKSRIGGATVLGNARHADALTVAGTVFGGDLIVDEAERPAPFAAFHPRPVGFSILPFTFARRYAVETRGPTTVALRDSIFSGNLSIATGADDDRLTMNNCFVDGYSRFATGAGDDFISIDNGTEFIQPTTLDEGEGDDHVYREVLRRFDFDKGKQGWKPYFSSYPSGAFVAKGPEGLETAEEAYELTSGLKDLPTPRETQERGFLLAGINGTDDMLFFIGRTFGESEGLLPNVTYQLQLEFSYSALLPHIARTLRAAVIKGPIQFGWDDGSGSPYRTLHVLGSNGRDFAERAGEIESIAPLEAGVHHLSHTLRQTVTPDGSGASVLVALKNSHEDGAAIYFESVRLRFIPLKTAVHASAGAEAAR
jgi:hypothetical protein